MATANVIATKCPPIQVSTTIYNPNGASPTPPSGPSLTAGAIAIVAAFNRLSLRADMAVMHGCGACGIGEGLDVTTAGLTATVSAGIGISLGELSLPTGGTIALTPNTYNWVYLTKAGVISLVTAERGCWRRAMSRSWTGFAISTADSKPMINTFVSI